MFCIHTGLYLYRSLESAEPLLVLLPHKRVAHATEPLQCSNPSYPGSLCGQVWMDMLKPTGNQKLSWGMDGPQDQFPILLKSVPSMVLCQRCVGTTFGKTLALPKVIPQPFCTQQSSPAPHPPRLIMTNVLCKNKLFKNQ